jgi:hypothetical protein
LQKSIPVIVKAVFINLFNILPKISKNIVFKPSIRPDIRFPALTGYPAKTVSGASLVYALPQGIFRNKDIFVR